MRPKCLIVQSVFPTCVGVNREAGGAQGRPGGVPHVRGGEPWRGDGMFVPM